MGSFPATMAMKKIVVTYLILALAGCSASTDELDSGVSTGAEISFATGMAPSIVTRNPIISNGDGVVEQEDIAGVQVLRDDNAAPFAGGISARTAIGVIKAAASGSDKNQMTLTPGQYFKVDHSDAHFMAYFPEGSTPSAGVVNYTIDGTQDIITSSRETAVFQSKNEVSFQFSHQLTQVILKVTAANEAEAAVFGHLKKASISVPTSLQLSIDGDEFKLEKTAAPNAVLSFLPNGQPVKLLGGATPQEIGRLMIYPEAFAKMTLEFTNKDEQEYDLQWDNSSLELLKPGTTNIVTIDLKAFEIRFSVSVVPWGVGNGTGEEIIIGGS